MEFKTNIIALSFFSLFMGVNTDVQTNSSKNNLVNLHAYSMNEQNAIFFIFSVGVSSYDVVLGLYIKL
jgi:NADH:ubiquinone oxidoreductase subunit K